MQLEDLQRRIGIVREAVERNAELSRRMATGRTSKFWAEIFGQRRIYPDINALMVSRREGAIAGAGDNPQGSLDREQERNATSAASSFAGVLRADSKWAVRRMKPTGAPTKRR